MSTRLHDAAARAVPHLLLAAALIALGFLVREWAYATTYRLYLTQRIDAGTDSTATQRFDVEGDRVVPQIRMRDDRVAFRAAIGRAATVRAEVRPRGAARYDIRATRDGRSHSLCSGDVTAPVAVTCRFPEADDTVEIAARGDLAWVDLRIQRDVHTMPQILVLAVVAAVGLFRRRSTHRPGRPAASVLTPRAAYSWATIITVLASTAGATAAVEGGLRLAGGTLPASITTARRDFGELMADPRWQPSARYGQRLSPNFDGRNAWRHGDIIRMGFLSPSLGEGTLHRFAFHTDAEGFRNAATRDRIDVAALGDSFTDALTLPVEAGWPMQLERRLGAVVQNYGTAGFGPQQELFVLEDFALRHHPRLVVLGFFAGNDLRDAEVFASTGRTDAAVGHPQLGWPIKDVVSRADTWYLTTAVRAAIGAVDRASAAELSAAPAHSARRDVNGASFDRGVFTVPVNGRTLRWALMPPYLRQLMSSEADLVERPGWKLAQHAIGEMQRRSQEAGATFVVMFLPFKSQVYLPLLERSFSPAALTAGLQFSFRQMNDTADLDRMSRNRLVLNGLMQRFCERAGIQFLDTTPALTARVDAGENVYFPDDSHLNQAGEAVVAAALAEFLRKGR